MALLVERSSRDPEVAGSILNVGENVKQLPLFGLLSETWVCVAPVSQRAGILCPEQVRYHRMDPGLDRDPKWGPRFAIVVVNQFVTASLEMSVSTMCETYF